MIRKLTDAQREEIIRRRKAGERGMALAVEFGVSDSTVSNLVKPRQTRIRVYETNQQSVFEYKWQPRKISVAMPHVIPGISMARLMGRR